MMYTFTPAAGRRVRVGLVERQIHLADPIEAPWWIGPASPTPSTIESSSTNLTRLSWLSAIAWRLGHQRGEPVERVISNRCVTMPANLGQQLRGVGGGVERRIGAAASDRPGGFTASRIEHDDVVIGNRSTSPCG